MFPNPQAALPLPRRPDLEQTKKQAKELVKACKSDAIAEWASKWVESLAKLLGDPSIVRRAGDIEEFAGSRMPRTAKCQLADAQFVIARSHGFTSWPRFTDHIKAVVRASSPVSRFELAADAIVDGDLVTLGRLLRDDRNLIRARSTREHRATLLHYVSANGVEGYRQKTPANAVQIAEVLLDAGAEVDAEADVYGGGATALGLVATSIHPYRAGVQNALMELLLRHGAVIDRPGVADRRHTVVTACLANGRGEAAEFLAMRGARLDLDGAAGVGRLDVVKALMPIATKTQLASAFMWACQYGRNTIIEFLLDNGVDVSAQDDAGQTGMHHAAIGGQLGAITLLLKRHAPLEARNVYGGTVLRQALWSAAHGGDAETYGALIEALIAAGAEVRERHPPVNERIDALLDRYGSRSDPNLWWAGDEPGEK